ncbi:RNA polymerase sigma factor [Pseudoalteromonas spongiae]|uniref:RNA polymerase sigma factor n=1 Tax=Pseudoalteromonas spongiae TaxID=298657 RepID=UPI00110C036D|nr:sigma-70 family RNA polymerase sigma factor [Pseudoalteromonas spongiae]TMO84309.1 hypothetical protein CWC15_11945 [Pseudoalteromonas spongiae]
MISMQPPYTAERIYQHCMPLMQQHLAKKVACSETRKDLSQELYLKLMLVENWHSIGNINAYVTTMLNNLIIDFYRKSSKELVDDVDLDSLKADTCPEQYVGQHLAIEKIQQLLNKQKPEMKDLIWRAKINGDSCRNIACDKGRSLSWVEKSLANLQSKCRQLILGSQHND